MNAFRFTAEPYLELSSTLGKLGVFDYSASVDPRSAFPLLDQHKYEEGLEHKHDVLSEATRKRVLEDVEQWRSRKLVKTLMKKRTTRDRLLEHLDQLKARGMRASRDVQERWVQGLAQVGDTRLVDFLAEKGVPDLMRRGPDVDPAYDVVRIANVCKRPIDSVQFYPAWFRFLDGLVENKVPCSRAAWLIKTITLLAEKKRMEDSRLDALRLYMLVRPTTELLMQFVTFTLAERPVNTRSMNQNGYSSSPGGDTTTIDHVDRWRRAASLVRWMFEDGLLCSTIMLSEWAKIVRSCFGLEVPGQAPPPATTARSSPIPSATAPAASALGPDILKPVVLSEFCSYVPEATKMGFAMEFGECLRTLRSSGKLDTLPGNVTAIKQMVDTSVEMCDVALASMPWVLTEPVWTEDKCALFWEVKKLASGLAWDPASLSSTPIIDVGERLGKLIWDALLRSGFNLPMKGCLALLEIACSTSPKQQQEETLYVTSLAIEEFSLNGSMDAHKCIDEFLTMHDLDDNQVALLGRVLSLLLLRGVPVDIRVDGTHPKQVQATTAVTKGVRTKRSFFEVLARTEFASQAILNAAGVTKDEDLSAGRSKGAENIEAALLAFAERCEESASTIGWTHEELHHSLSPHFPGSFPPSLRITAMLVAIEHVQLHSLMCVVVPLLESSLMLRHLLTDSRSSDISKRLRSLITARMDDNDIPAAAKQRLNELLDPQSVNSNGATSGSTYGGGSSGPRRSFPGGASRTGHLVLSHLNGVDRQKEDLSELATLKDDDAAHYKTVAEAENARFKEGCTWNTERIEQVLKLVKARGDELNVPQWRLFLWVRDLMACRGYADRQVLCGWCVQELGENPTPEAVSFALENGLCRVNDLINKWLPRRIIVPHQVLEALAKPHVLTAFQTQVDVYFLRYLNVLVSAQLSDQAANVFFAAAAELAFSRGVETLQLLREGNLISLVRSLSPRLAPQPPALDMALDLAARSWVSHPHVLDVSALVSFALNEAQSGNIKRAINAASIIVTWQYQEEACSACIRALQQSNIVLNAAMSVFLARCVRRSSSDRKVQVAEFCAENLLADKPNNFARPLLYYVLLGAVTKDPHDSRPALPSDTSLRVIQNIDPVKQVRLAMEIASLCTGNKKSGTLSSLILHWKTKYPEHAHVLSAFHRFLDRDIVITPQQPQSIVENCMVYGDAMALLGSGSSYASSVTSVDAWSVVETAPDSDANCEFLRNAIVRPTHHG